MYLAPCSIDASSRGSSCLVPGTAPIRNSSQSHKEGHDAVGATHQHVRDAACTCMPLCNPSMDANADAHPQLYPDPGLLVAFLPRVRIHSAALQPVRTRTREIRKLVVRGCDCDCASHSLPLLEQLRHLGGQYESTSVVPAVKVHQRHCRLLWQIFMNEVARFRKDLQGVFPCTHTLW